MLSALPGRRGHFLLESGYHTDLWLTLDAMFVEPATTAPLVSRLAERLRRHDITAVCGPLLGGAFLAQGLATTLGVRFYCTVPDAKPRPPGAGLFTARYYLPAGVASRIRGERIAVVDDVISAGSSVRATIAALDDAGASTIVVGSFMMLGEAGVRHFAERALPVETLDRQPFNLWQPADCPLCAAGSELQDPLAR
jgi:orotate phosphoribosyltransferase